MGETDKHVIRLHRDERHSALIPSIQTDRNKRTKLECARNDSLNSALVRCREQMLCIVNDPLQQYQGYALPRASADSDCQALVLGGPFHGSAVFGPADSERHFRPGRTEIGHA
jgi:hypothetical protein